MVSQGEFAALKSCFITCIISYIYINIYMY
jgi:hypothetical protein